MLQVILGHGVSGRLAPGGAPLPWLRVGYVRRVVEAVMTVLLALYVGML